MGFAFATVGSNITTTKDKTPSFPPSLLPASIMIHAKEIMPVRFRFCVCWLDNVTPKDIPLWNLFHISLHHVHVAQWRRSREKTYPALLFNCGSNPMYMGKAGDVHLSGPGMTIDLNAGIGRAVEEWALFETYNYR